MILQLSSLPYRLNRVMLLAVISFVLSQIPCQIFFRAECANAAYVHAHGSDTTQVGCVAKVDTPCGNLADTFTFDPAVVNVTCASFESA